VTEGSESSDLAESRFSGTSMSAFPAMAATDAVKAGLVKIILDWRISASRAERVVGGIAARWSSATELMAENLVGARGDRVSGSDVAVTGLEFGLHSLSPSSKSLSLSSSSSAKPFSYMPITSSKLGSSGFSSEVTELSFVITLLRSVTAVPGVVEAVNWDLKLDRNSSPLNHGAPPPRPGLARVLEPGYSGRPGTGVRADERAGGPVTFLARGGLGSPISAFACSMGEAYVAEDLTDEPEGRLGRCH
jgi:hypothetical protein